MSVFLYSQCEQSNVEHVKEYKRVAIVEDFFDIIYSVHVEMDGRGGKHAGQKRTYRAVCCFLPLYCHNICIACKYNKYLKYHVFECKDCKKNSINLVNLIPAPASNPR